MTKYIAVLDYKAHASSPFEHIPLKSKSLVDAMSEAEKYRDASVYCISIAQKYGKAQKLPGGYQDICYAEILRARSSGWHRCDADHGESSAVWKMTQGKTHSWYEFHSLRTEW